MKNKKYLNETAKYEIWRTKFRKEMQQILTDIFKRRMSACWVSVYSVDKWNVYFNIRSIRSDITRLIDDPALNGILEVAPLWDEVTACCCELHAKTEEEFNTKLGYLKIAL